MISRTFILVHGLGPGAACWRYVTPLLRASGHHVLTPDLPGQGQDRTSLSEVTLRSSVDRIGDLVELATGSVILVGHSLSGVVVSQVAEEHPLKIAQLVYVAALVPEDGESVVDVLAAHPQGFAFYALEKVDQGVRLRSDQLEKLLYHDCPREAVRQAHKLLKAEVQALWFAPVTLTSRSERVPCAYILCTEDRIISLAMQQRMASTCDLVVELPSGHSPFFALPERLAECLLAFASTEQNNSD